MVRFQWMPHLATGAYDVGDLRLTGSFVTRSDHPPDSLCANAALRATFPMIRGFIKSIAADKVAMVFKEVSVLGKKRLV